MKYGLDVKTAKPVSPTIENNPPDNFRNLVSTVDSRNSNKRIPVLEQLITSKDNIEKVKTLNKTNKTIHGLLLKIRILSRCAVSTRLQYAHKAKKEIVASRKRQKVEVEGCFIWMEFLPPAL